MTDLPLHHAIAAPSPWVTRFAPLIGPGQVLDLACGSGRHAKWLAGLGYSVLAVDRDETALAQAQASGPRIAVMRADLESDAGPAWPFEAQRFAAIIVTNYLHRPLFPHIVASLEDEGVLIYETFAAGNEQFGKPSNPNFLLQAGELLNLCSGFRVVAFEDGYVGQPRPAMVQRICAIKPGSGTSLERLRLN
jgi:SAM-dependent methyltransferase